MSFKTILGFLLPVLLLPSSPLAKLPDPENCTVVANVPTAGCQFRFRADGGLDELQIHASVRDVWNAPIENCRILARIKSTSPTTEALCACTTCATQWKETDSNGLVDFVFRKIGGRGTLKVELRSICTIDSALVGSVTIPFTSPDLDGSGSGANPIVIPACKASPASATDILDLAIWAGGLAPGYAARSDYDCSGAPVDVLDLATWVGGLGVGCVPGCP